MAQRLQVPPPAPFSTTSSRASTAWTKWMRQFNYYVTAAGITDSGQKKALLLHTAGPEVQDLFETLTIPAAADGQTDYDLAFGALTTYFSPTPNIAFERHQFRQAAQRTDESVDDYCTRLKALAASCGFSGQMDEHIRDQFVDKCLSSALRRRLLRETNLTLKSLLDIARASEAAAQQAAVMEGHTSPHAQPPVDSQVNAASHFASRPGQSRGERRPPSRGPPPRRLSPNEGDCCGNCGISGHKHTDPNCPARGQQCHRCKKTGHYGRVCRSSRFSRPRPRNNPVRAVEEEAADEPLDSYPTDDEYNFHVDSVHAVLARTSVHIDGHNVRMVIDSGASVNIVDSVAWDWMRDRDHRLRLTPSNVRLYGYGAKQPLPTRGEFVGNLHAPDTGKSTRSRVVVVDGDGGCLLSRDTAVALGLLTIHPKVNEEYIDAILTYAIPKAMTSTEIRDATRNDACLTKLMETIKSGRWNAAERDPMIADYARCRNEFSIKNGIILRGTRIVMPKSLWSRTLNIAHETHQGVVRTKQLLRTKVWWPKIDNQVEKLIQECRSCQIQSRQPPHQPLHPSVMPPHPWHTLHVDLCGPLPTGETLLVAIDNASRWPEVKILRSTTTTSVTNSLDTIFATHGLPIRIVTDNGPQFASAQFGEYCANNGISHRKISPYHPQANGEVERFNATIMKGIRAAIADNRDWRRALPGILLVYRSTTHPATGESPAKLLLNRDIRNKLPTTTTAPQSPTYRRARKQDAEYKTHMKETSDKKFRAKNSEIKQGDDVIILQRRTNKFDTRYDPQPWKVKCRKGESVIIERQGRQTMRHLSQVRKFVQNAPSTADGLSDIDDLDDRKSPSAPAGPERPPQAEHHPPLRRSDRPSRPPSRLTYYRGGAAM